MKMQKKHYLGFVLFFLSFSSWGLDESCTITGKKSSNSKSTVINAIPARVQWNSTDGYCGEVSLISAGLYYGQYMSQYDARALANIDFSAKNTQLTQLLIGDFGATDNSNNVSNALANMHLNFEQFDNVRSKNKGSQQFLAWVKKHIILHHPVVIGVYENAAIFDNNADAEYDHLVPVFGIKSTGALTDLYAKDDVIYLHDNGLYTGKDSSLAGCYQYSLAGFQKDRKGASVADGNLYSLSNNDNHLGNFGVAITGVKAKGVTLMPVSIQTDPVSEYPEIRNNSNVRPSPQNIVLTIQVSELKPQTYYVVYKYTGFSDLPADDDFSKSYGNPAQKCHIWLPAGDDFIMQEQVLSDSMAIYRVIVAKEGEETPPECVQASVP